MNSSLLLKISLQHIITGVPASGDIMNHGVFRCMYEASPACSPIYVLLLYSGGKKTQLLVDSCCDAGLIMCAKHPVWGPSPASLVEFTIFLALSVVTGTVLPGLSIFHSETASFSLSSFHSEAASFSISAMYACALLINEVSLQNAVFHVPLRGYEVGGYC